jgi:hypothetical protein
MPIFFTLSYEEGKGRKHSFFRRNFPAAARERISCSSSSLSLVRSSSLLPLFTYTLNLSAPFLNKQSRKNGLTCRARSQQFFTISSIFLARSFILIFLLIAVRFTRLCCLHFCLPCISRSNPVSEMDCTPWSSGIGTHSPHKKNVFSKRWVPLTRL